MTESPESQRRRLELLQAQLESRLSILHWAHAVIFGLLACLMTVAATRLAREARQDFYAVAAGLTAFLWVYALVRAGLALRAKRIEDARFTELLALRRSLQLDNPSLLLHK